MEKPTMPPDPKNTNTGADFEKDVDSLYDLEEADEEEDNETEDGEDES